MIELVSNNLQNSEDVDEGIPLHKQNFPVDVCFQQLSGTDTIPRGGQSSGVVLALVERNG